MKTGVKMGEISAENNARYYGGMDEIDFYTHQVAEVFTKFKVDGAWSNSAIKKIVVNWLRKKEPLMAILRNHPMWNEREKAIIVPVSETRCVNSDYASYILSEEISTLKNSAFIDYPDYETWAYIMNHTWGATITEQEEREFLSIDTDNELKLSAHRGAKTTRILQRAFASMRYSRGDSKFDISTPSFQKAFAKLSDALSPKNQEVKFVLSVHIRDYLLMSHGNSWTSCHYINSNMLFHDGEAHYSGTNKSGTLSYAGDSVSMVMYSIDQKFPDLDIGLEKKRTRQMFMYNNHALLQSRLYPKGLGGDDSLEQRASWVKEIFTKCSDCDNAWCEIGLVFKTAPLATHYPDYRHFSYRTWSQSGEMPTARIGSAPICINSGIRHNRPDRLSVFRLDNDGFFVESDPNTRSDDDNENEDEENGGDDELQF